MESFSIHFNCSTKNDSVILFQGTFDEPETAYHQFLQQTKTSLEGNSFADDNGKFERQYFNLDLKTKIPLAVNLPVNMYKILVRSSITNFEGQTLREPGLLEIGFSINHVTVEYGELI